MKTWRSESPGASSSGHVVPLAWWNAELLSENVQFIHWCKKWRAKMPKIPKNALEWNSVFLHGKKSFFSSNVKVQLIHWCVKRRGRCQMCQKCSVMGQYLSDCILAWEEIFRQFKSQWDQPRPCDNLKWKKELTSKAFVLWEFSLHLCDRKKLNPLHPHLSRRQSAFVAERARWHASLWKRNYSALQKEIKSFNTLLCGISWDSIISVSLQNLQHW